MGSQDAVALVLAPAHAAPELVELAEAEPVRVLHDHQRGVGKMLDEKRDNTIKRFSKTYWLTGPLHCPFCGGKYTIANSARKTYYLCSNRLNRKNDDTGIDTTKEKCTNNKYINADVLEKKVEELIKILEQLELKLELKSHF